MKSIKGNLDLHVSGLIITQEADLHGVQSNISQPPWPLWLWRPDLDWVQPQISQLPWYLIGRASMKYIETQCNQLVFNEIM